MKTLIKGSGLGVKLRSNTILSTLMAAGIVSGSVLPAYAAIDNTATVSGTAPDTSTVTATDDVSVDVVDDDAELTIAKAAALTTDTDTDTLGDENDVITYTYTVTNSGNTSMEGVVVTDTHDGTGTFGTPVIAASSATGTTGASSVDLLPGEIAIFEVAYTITAADISGAGGTGVGATVDGDIDNSAVAVGDYPDGSADPADYPEITSAPDVAEVSLDVVGSLVVAKSAYDDDGVPTILGGAGATALGTATDNIEVGTVITYVYEVENDGNLPMSLVGVSDVHDGTGTLGAITLFSLDNTNGSVNVDVDPNSIDVLEPGDSAIFTATYTVTQEDIDTLQ